jgi:hypothetical protein
LNRRSGGFRRHFRLADSRDHLLCGRAPDIVACALIGLCR